MVKTTKMVKTRESQLDLAKTLSMSFNLSFLSCIHKFSPNLLRFLGCFFYPSHRNISEPVSCLQELFDSPQCIIYYDFSYRSHRIFSDPWMSETFTKERRIKKSQLISRKQHESHPRETILHTGGCNSFMLHQASWKQRDQLVQCSQEANAKFH